VEAPAGAAVSDGALRVGLVGLGVHARSVLLPALEALPDVRVVGAADPDEGARRGCAVPSWSSTDDLLDSSGAEAVVVSVPPGVSGEAARAVAARGLHLYLEKPCGASAADVAAIAADVERTDRVVAAGLNYRSDAGVQHLRGALRAGAVGEPVTARAVFTVAAPAAGSWRAGTVLRDLGVHEADLLRFVLDEPVRAVTATVSTPGHGVQIATVCAELGSLQASLVLGFGAAEHAALEVIGTEGRVQVDQWDAPWLVHHRSQAAGPVRALGGRLRAALGPAGLLSALRRPPGGGSHASALGLWAAACRGGAVGAAARVRLPTLDDARRALAVVEAAERSAATGSRVVVD
jgi:predicted dehydrogenase